MRLVRSAFVFGLVHVAVARAQTEAGRPRVVWVNADAALTAAGRAALSGWGLDCASVDNTALAPDAAQLHALAESEHAAIVVWIERRAGAAQLSVYDREHDQLLGTREIPALPLDAATAAAVALSVKRYLRPTGLAQTQDRKEPAAVSSNTAELPPQRRELKAQPAALTLDLAAISGIAWGLELRYGISATLRRSGASWGMSADVSGSTGIRAQIEGASVRLYDPAVALMVLWRVPLNAAWSISALGGPALQLAAFRAHTTADARQLTATRFCPQLQAQLRVQVLLAERVFLGVWAGGNVALLAQRYWIGEELVLQSRRVSLLAYVAIGVHFEP